MENPLTQNDLKLVGRESEQVELEAVLNLVRQGKGGIFLLTGEAGVGKTRLATECLRYSGLFTLRSTASEIFTPPYGPIISAIRSYMRMRPANLGNFGSLSRYLALILPEFGPFPEAGDRASLAEAIRCAFLAMAKDEPMVFHIEDLQWADIATLELLPGLAASLAQERLLILATYRNDEIPRGHPVRRLRNELRRAGLLREITLEPLKQDATTLFVAQILGSQPGPVLATTLYEKTEGLPLFVEELTRALLKGRSLRSGQTGLELDSGTTVPIPDTLRDTILLQLDGLPAPALRLLEIASVIGSEFELSLVENLAGGTEGLNTIFERGLFVEGNEGQTVFRHALEREAIYRDISWVQRRVLHHQVAEQLAAQGAHPSTIAEHWLAAQETELARAALIAASGIFYRLHAYQDAIVAAQKALSLWPTKQDEAGRLNLLDQLAHAAQLGGSYAEATRAWREVAAGWEQLGHKLLWAEAERKLANVCELQGHWEQSLAAREMAAQLFFASELSAEAAAEHLAAAAHLRSAARYRAALELLSQAEQEVDLAQRQDLKARILGLKGNVLARMGQTESGLLLVREALALALEQNLAIPAAEIYQRLADSLEHAGEYQDARETYLTAFDFCQANAIPATAQLCISCLAVVLRQVGDWERSMTLCRTVLASEHSTIHARGVGSGILGLIYVLRGQLSRARPLLLEATTLARRIELLALELLSNWGLAMLYAYNGEQHLATERCQLILSRWEQIEDRHYAVPVFRWIATFFTQTKNAPGANACANALARIATDTGQPEALSALAHALGEIALFEGQARQAVQQFSQSLKLLGENEAPYCQALTGYRLGVALAVAENHQAALECLSSAYRIARRLGTTPLAGLISDSLSTLETPGNQREKPVDHFQRHLLTKRQLEVLRLMAQGQTTPEIARQLILSPRTVEMHVSNILAAFDSRSRTEVARKALDMGLLSE
jgi:predicted ATPase/DNA-binding CsgD family transcriptional regulator